MLLQPQGGSCKETRHSVDYFFNSLVREYQSFVILQMTHSGYGVFEQANRKWKVSSGSLFISIIPENASYYYPREAREPWEFSWLNFLGSSSVSYWQEFRKEFGPVIQLGNIKEVQMQFHQLIRLTRSSELIDPYTLSAEAYRFMMSLYSQAQGDAGRQPSVTQQVVSLIRRRPGQPLVVKELADQVGLSREHFSRLFKVETGMSPAAFRRKLQLQEAAALLKRTRLTVREVAERTGFGDSGRLIRQFKGLFGCTPLVYREESRSSL